MRRFFIQPDAIQGETVVLSREQSRHLVSVLRLLPGQSIELFDGGGSIYQATITKTIGRQVECSVTARCARDKKHCFPLTLAQGVLKGKKMDLVLQKATELGVDTFVPTVTRYCDQQGTLEQRMRRWQRIVIEACKQCGRNTAMHISPVQTLESIDCALFPYPLFCWEGKHNSRIGAGFFTDPGSVLLLIGPEGGFHESEVDWARENGCVPISLGPLVLRAETAAIAAVGIVQYLSMLSADSSPA